MNPTPSPHDDGVDPAIGAEVSRLLDGVAATTVLDVDASWESFEARRAAGDGPHRRRPGPPVLLAVAAAALAVLGLTVAALRGDDGGVAIDDNPPATDDTLAPTTTDPTVPKTTTTGASTESPADTSVPEDTGVDEPSRTTTTPSTPPPAPRTPAALTLASADYTVELLYDEATKTVYFRRTDDAGSTVDGPDAYGHHTSSGWGGLAGPACLVSSGGEVAFPGAPAHAFTYGLASSDVARVEVVMSGGARRPATLGAPDGAGMRVWLLERPLGALDRIEGLDTGGNVVATITELSAGDWGSSGC